MSAATLAFGAVSFRDTVLPWSIAADDERRFRRIVRNALLLALIFLLLLPWVPLRKEERTELQRLPPPLAKLLLETKPLPPPTPAPPPPAPVKPDPVVAQADAPKAKDKPEPVKPDPRAPVPEARNPQPNKPPGEVLENARRKASGVGLLAMKNELAQMTGAPLAVQLRDDIKPGPGVGTGSGPGVGAGTEAGIPVRSMITSAAGKGSGGINIAAYSRDTGGGGLAGRATTLVEGVAGGGGGGGVGGGGSRAGGGKGGDGAGGTLRKSGSGKASRSIEEIKLVFERHKGAIYALYNRALRDEPSLQGKVVLELTIAPTGEVTAIRLVSSELKAAELEGKLLARIRQFDFGAKDVEVMVVSWPVDFLPS
jgi:outer membrane biosynthesis protein TonB